MKTLKLQLLAASMFACTAAFAQGSANGPPALGTASPNAAAANYATGPNASSNNASFNSSRANYVNDAYVLQQGDSQYANVSQKGGFSANGASPAASNQSDVLQIGGSRNNAFVTQEYTRNGAPKNVAYIRQDGLDGTATQIQSGSANTASIEQIGNGMSTGNTAYQNQQGDEHKAGIRQENGDRDQAIQFQYGSKQYSTIDQNGGAPSRAETYQTGASNAAIVTQR